LTGIFLNKYKYKYLISSNLKIRLRLIQLIYATTDAIDDGILRSLVIARHSQPMSKTATVDLWHSVFIFFKIYTKLE
jgi:hypothetical protein